MNILLIGYRQNVWQIKYRLLFQNWNLNFRQCYSFKASEQALQQEKFDYIIHCLFDFDTKIQYQKLSEFNRQFRIPVRVWQED